MTKAEKLMNYDSERSRMKAAPWPSWSRNSRYSVVLKNTGISSLISGGRVEQAGILGLFVFVAGGLEKPLLAIGGFLLMTIAACLQYRNRLSLVVRRPFFFVAIGFSTFVVLIAVLKYLNNPNELAVTAEWTIIYLAAGGLPALVVAAWLESRSGRTTRQAS